MVGGSGRIHSSIFIGDDEGALGPTDVYSTLPPPIVFTGQKLNGSLHITHYGVEEGIFDAVHFILKGQVRSNVKVLGGTIKKVEQPLIRMSCVKLAADFQRVGVEGSLNIGHQTEFFFDIPDFITLPSDKDSKPQKLPPSITIVKYPPCAIGGNCDVSYHIQARILNGETVMSQATREIIIMPTTEIPPPLDPEDLQKEFQLTAASSLGSFWHPTKAFTVVASSMEPRPLVFPVNKDEHGSTEMLLNFKTWGISDKHGEMRGPQLTDCEVMITLEAVTYFLEHEQESVMSVNEAQQSPCTVLKKTTFKTEVRRVHLLGWRKSREIVSDTTSRIFEWETEVSVPVVLPGGFSRLPSFFSTLITRRYAFNLQIALGPKYRIHGRKSIKLRVPVQIIHAPIRKCANAPAEIDFNDFESPPYTVLP